MRAKIGMTENPNNLLNQQLSNMSLINNIRIFVDYCLNKIQKKIDFTNSEAIFHQN